MLHSEEFKLEQQQQKEKEKKENYLKDLYNQEKEKVIPLLNAVSDSDVTVDVTGSDALFSMEGLLYYRVIS